MPPPVALDALINSGAPDPARLLVAVDVVDPGNAGALVRTAHASGAAAFVALGVTDPYHPRATRTSLGSLFRLPILRYATTAPFLAELDRQQTVKPNSNQQRANRAFRQNPVPNRMLPAIGHSLQLSKRSLNVFLFWLGPEHRVERFLETGFV